MDDKKNRMTLMYFLEWRLAQLEQRKMMIPRYVERPEKFVGKKDFSLDDMPKIQIEIEETKVAIKAVKSFRKGQTKCVPNL